MSKRQRVVILDAGWEIKAVASYVDDVLTEYPEYLHLRDTVVELIIHQRLREFSLMFAAQLPKVNSRAPIPDSLYRYLYSVPTELAGRVDKELYKRERHMRTILGEVQVADIRIKIRESLLEITC